MAHAKQYFEDYREGQTKKIDKWEYMKTAL